MKQGKRNKLSKLGYRVTDTQEFLGLSDGAMAIIDLKISLIDKLKATRSSTEHSVLTLIRSRCSLLEYGRERSILAQSTIRP